MLEDLTPDSFRPHVGTRFAVEVGPDGPEVTLELVDVTPVPKSGLGTREEPFSLMFHGPHEPRLVQHVFTLRHDELGALEIFLVPVAPDPSDPTSATARYEAIFN
ncbi:MAG TPA: hypothetical protein VHJ34_06620 [Actinomycetota bacterium]|nr:hypothetical protein [Actinomycetota bacterium]